MVDTTDILEELKARDPIFHHPEKFGTSKQDIENQMCDAFTGLVVTLIGKRFDERNEI